MDEVQFAGSIVLITGAAQGIGESAARSLAHCGAIVVAVDKKEMELMHLVDELRGEGKTAYAFVADVSDSRQVENIVSEVEGKIGPIDGLVNVAGVFSTGTLTECRDEEWRRLFSINTDGVFYTLRAVGKRMKNRGKGAIVTISSNAASVPRASMAAYASSKAAATMLTKCLALELAEFGIRCNIISPGSTDTAMQRMLWEDGTGQEKVIAGDPENYRVGIPLKKIAKPSEITDTILFLLSDKASHITMNNLCIDGGASLGAQ